MKQNLLFNICAANPQVMMAKVPCTHAQYHVLLQCLQGLSTRQSAQSLNLSFHTVKYHRSNMLQIHGFEKMDQLIVHVANIAIDAIIQKHRAQKEIQP